jgi:hypothetical protein
LGSTAIGLSRRKTLVVSSSESREAGAAAIDGGLTATAAPSLSLIFNPLFTLA